MDLRPLINIMQRSAVLFCFFFYLYSVQLRGMPFGSRVVLAMLGLFFLVFRMVKEIETKGDAGISKRLLIYALSFAAIIFVSFFTVIFNGTHDYEFIKYPVSLVLILLAGYFIYKKKKKSHRQLSYETVMYYIICAVLIQVLLALISFLSPAFSDLLLSIQTFSELDISKIEETATLRLTGFGSTFFGAGIVNGYALICIAVLLKNKNIKWRNILFLSTSFLLIFTLGMMMSRTTIIGAGIAIIYLFIPSYYLSLRLLKNKFRFFMGMIIIPAVGIYIISLFSPKTMQLLETAADFGFEMFINYQETGEFSSKSTDVLQTMFVWPSNAKTYIIGDGKYYNDPGNTAQGYYMYTDVGYLRLIYYFGITGLLIYFLLQLGAVRNAFVLNPGKKELKKFLLLTFLFCLVLNIKGFADLFFLTTLFCMPFQKYETPQAV